eukprot:Protomagalhaensia_wolfi_Nauph_80__381@NODE_120_length_3581_cov_237_449181_g92_i0_p3_GENE_NODE_120_length_3581_cov_237_449181_g92_i0NODE_120_length_3581_cov_237_449181_g92_i0_p3_ORF_typecomplete_len223_score30_72_NODE_120_length_3581_cov_237_449181_g92_i0123791
MAKRIKSQKETEPAKKRKVETKSTSEDDTRLFLSETLQLSQDQVEQCVRILNRRFDNVTDANREVFDTSAILLLKSGLIRDSTPEFFSWLLEGRLERALQVLVEMSMTCPRLRGMAFLVEQLASNSSQQSRQYVEEKLLPRWGALIANVGAFLLKGNLDGIENRALAAFVEGLVKMTEVSAPFGLEALRSVLKSYECQLDGAVLDRINNVLTQKTVIGNILN